MARYIDADKIDWRITFDSKGKKVKYITRGDIKAMPAADVQPVVHGKWMETPYVEYGETIFGCSHCNAEYTVEYGDIGWEYCPNCGARMDGDTNGKHD